MSTFVTAAHADTDAGAALESVAHLNNYQVVELRRYDIAPGQRDRFVRYFDAYFPEAFEQLDCMVFGQFEDRAAPTKFVWLRGYHDIDARPIVDAAFYYGPVWREHRVKVNALFPGASDNVLLLRPVTSSSAFAVPMRERAPVGSTLLSESRILATIYYCDAPVDDEFRRFFDSEVAATLSETGATPIAQFETESAANTFPRLPVREGEHVFIWFAAFAGEAALREHERQLAASPRWTSEVVPALTKYLKSPPERLILEPTPRSRLR